MMANSTKIIKILRKTVKIKKMNRKSVKIEKIRDRIFKMWKTIWNKNITKEDVKFEKSERQKIVRFEKMPENTDRIEKC